MATIQDIAKKAGVGVGTVSRMLKGNGYVSGEKRELIRKAMEELNYVPKKPAVIMHTEKRTGLIGVVTPHIEHPFFCNMVMHLENELKLRNYYSVLINEENYLDRQIDALKLLDEGKIDGIINMSSMPEDFPGRNGRPIVAFDRDWGDTVPNVRSDHRMGARIVADEFLREGHMSVVQFIGGKDINASANERHKELKRIIEENGGEVFNIMAEWDSLSYEYNADLIYRYRPILERAQGCMTNDIGAICCHNLMMRIGRRVPEDFKIIAYDGTELIHLTQPALPAIRQDTMALSRKLVEVLFDMMNGNEPEKLLYEIPVSLI